MQTDITKEGSLAFIWLDSLVSAKDEFANTLLLTQVFDNWVFQKDILVINFFKMFTSKLEVFSYILQTGKALQIYF